MLADDARLFCSNFLGKLGGVLWYAMGVLSFREIERVKERREEKMVKGKEGVV